MVKKPITVLLAEDQATFRQSLRLLVEMEGDIEIIGEARNGREAIQLSARLNPEVIIMDIAMPLLNGLQATREIRGATPHIRVLILSAHLDPEYIWQAMKWGASGYLLKQASTTVLPHAIREVQKGRAYFSTAIPRELRVQCQKFHGKGARPKKRLVQPVISARSR